MEGREGEKWRVGERERCGGNRKERSGCNGREKKLLHNLTYQSSSIHPTYICWRWGVSIYAWIAQFLRCLATVNAMRKLPSFLFELRIAKYQLIIPRAYIHAVPLAASRRKLKAAIISPWTSTLCIYLPPDSWPWTSKLCTSLHYLSTHPLCYNAQIIPYPMV